MSWRDALSANLPPSREDEPRDLRRDILDELEDHLHCAMTRELLRSPGIDESTAHRNVLHRFGDPAQIALKLWFDAMRGKVMTQRILIGTNIALFAAVATLAALLLYAVSQNRTSQMALTAQLEQMTDLQENLVESMRNLERMGLVPAPPTPAVGAATAPSLDPAAEARVLHARGDDRKRYILHGVPDDPGEEPIFGQRLLVVLPGGDGGADFTAFVEGISDIALAGGYLVAQAIAPVWDEQQPEQVVWPTTGHPWPGMGFTTEEFIASVIEDVQNRHALDDRHIYALGWASGGPPVYAAAMHENSPLRGAFVAMSVFRPEQLPAPEHARGRAFYILHSPQDFISMAFPQTAQRTLENAGANVTLQTYQGGHGWHGDVFALIRDGIDWLEQQSGR